MKRVISVLMLVMILIMPIFSITVLAKGEGAEYPIYDDAGLLTDTQLQHINDKLVTIRSAYKLDVTIIMEDQMHGDTAMETADDYFDYNGYGVGSNSDGILLYISVSPRNYHFSTHGSAMESFNDRGLAYLESKVLPYLKSNDYYGAATVYADTAEQMLQMAANGKPYNKRPIEEVLIVIAVVFLAPLLIAFTMTRIKLAQMKTAVKQNYAADYMKPGSMNIAASSDIFLYSTVTKTEKPKSNGSHTSSSGETHGGRGGSY